MAIHAETELDMLFMNMDFFTRYDCYALGYSFIMDGVPCTVGGAVIEEAQSEELIKEIHDTVEAMIRTLRTER